MIEPERVGEILRDADPANRILYFAALVGREASVPTNGLIVVGGSAVEIYTQGDYASGDIDLVVNSDRVVPVLKGWGFQRRGRIWYHPDWKITADVMQWEYHGSIAHTRVIATPHGAVRVEGIEDVVVRRLIASRYWHLPEDFGWALAVAAENRGRLDWEYAQRIARYDGVADLLEELRTRVDARPSRRP